MWPLYVRLFTLNEIFAKLRFLLRWLRLRLLLFLRYMVLVWLLGSCRLGVVGLRLLRKVMGLYTMVVVLLRKLLLVRAVGLIELVVHVLMLVLRLLIRRRLTLLVLRRLVYRLVVGCSLTILSLVRLLLLRIRVLFRVDRVRLKLFFAHRRIWLF